MACRYSSFELADRAGEFARDLYREGLRPSELVRELEPFVNDRGWSFNSVILVSIARAAFGLSIAECKDAPGTGRPSDDPAACVLHAVDRSEAHDLGSSRRLRTT